MAPWRRAGQWSLRLPCAAPACHASWGRLSSEGLGLTELAPPGEVGGSRGAPMLSAADAILATLGHGPFVFNLGHGIVPETPPEHVAALCEHLKAWRA